MEVRSVRRFEFYPDNERLAVVNRKPLCSLFDLIIKKCVGFFDEIL